ncbi:MAG: hypothetical protein MUC89_17510 [Acetobacteraceae bacterium]|jgi:hypothetical protein|nr:hypothetical protein [Acetobacteraceae bacterium]
MSADRRLEKCLNDRVEGGTLKREQAEDILRRVRDLEAENGAKVPKDEAEALARVAAEMKEEARLRKRQNALQVLRHAELMDRIENHPRGAYAGAAAIFARDMNADAVTDAAAAGSSVEGRHRAVLAILHGKVVDFLDAYRSKTLGLTRDTMGLRNMVRELYGEPSGDGVAAAAARGFTDAAEYARKRWVDGGGRTWKRDDWRLPQVWDKDRVSTLTRAQFSDALHDLVAAGKLRVVDWKTGEALDPLRTAEIISNAYDRITTDGLSDLIPGRVQAGRLANSREERRAFEWTSAEAWLEANERFGAGDGIGIYGLLTQHLDGIARDIGMLEVLGPSAHHQAQVVIDTARKAGIGDSKAYRLEALWDTVSGASTGAVNRAAAGFMRETRAFITAAKLGSATLSAVTDFGTLRMTAAWNGIPASDVMRRYMQMLTSGEARAAAVRTGLIAEGWARVAAASQRHQADIVGAGLGSRTADTVLRASGLNVHTDAGTWAFQVELLGGLADDAGKTFDQLRPEFRRGMARNGISADDWNIIRAAPAFDPGGGIGRVIHPESIAKLGRREADAAARLMQWVNIESDFAIPKPGARERALIMGKTQAGTLVGEFWRSTAQLKTFPVTMMTTHLMRGIEGYRGGDKGKYLVGLAVSLTVMGALAMQLKQLANGRDPRDMTQPAFWGAAFAQGGGAGIFGDFLYSGLTRADRGFYMTAIGGPMAGLVDDLARVTGGNIQGLAESKDTNFGGELARFARMNTPGTSLWYARLALDRLMWDRLQEMLDPDYARKFRRIENNARRDYGQEFWWRPGEASPSRAPAAAAALGPEQ